MKTCYTSGEAARICGLGQSTLKRWVRKGALRAFRTPGGDLRVRHDHLLDFMRRFDIPMQAEPAPTARVLLISLRDSAQRAALLDACARLYPQLHCVCAESDLNLGYHLAQTKPRYLVLESAGSASDARPEQLRKILAPLPVRLALVASDAIADGVTYDAVVSPEESGWAERLLEYLLVDWTHRFTMLEEVAQ